MKWKYLLLLLITCSAVATAQPRNELGFGGGYFKPYTLAPGNSIYQPKPGVAAYIIYDKNINPWKARVYPSVGMRAQMFLFSEVADRSMILYGKTRQNYFWPIISVPVIANYRQPLQNGNSLRVGIGAGPYVTIFPADDARPELGWQAEAAIGYSFKQTTLSVRMIQPMKPYRAVNNDYRGTAISLEAKFEVARRTHMRSMMPPEASKATPAEKRKPGAIPAVEMSVGYGRFQTFNAAPRKYSHYQLNGNISILNLECIFDGRGKGPVFSFGTDGTYMWANDIYLSSLGGHIGGMYQLPLGSKLKLRAGASMGPTILLRRSHTRTNGWWQSNAFADVQFGKRVSVSAKYILPFNRIEITDYQYENKSVDRLLLNVHGILLECKFRLSESK